jgi:hypothetical protein
MQGAAERQRRERGLVWMGSMLPWLKTPMPYEEFVGGAKARTAAPQSPEVLNAMIEGLAAAWGAKVH